MAVLTMVSARRRHQQMMAPAAAQATGPRILIHDINDDRCTGCDACVAVCPTNVLDLVANKSRVLRFHDCIQCEACMFACPTEALVMFPEGSMPPPLKVPEVDENFQTAVPGQYLIGEVAGKPLVKNAANLGRAVVEHMLVTGLRGGAIGGRMGTSERREYDWYFRACFPRLTRTVYLMVRDLALAEDIAQEALYRMLRHWRTVSTYDRPEAWARRVTRVGGWSLALSGLVYAGLWAVAPIQVAAAGGSLAVLLGIAVTIGYCLSLRGKTKAS
jgi:ferredoxin